MNAQVLIVAKTRMKGLACIGGLRLDTYQGVRLLRPDGTYQPGTTTYQVGQLWDMDFERFNMRVPPHVEDILVFDQRLVGTQQDIHGYLRQQIVPWNGSPHELFDQQLCFTTNGSGYITHNQGLPSVSTGFWLCQRPLRCVQSKSGIHYEYSDTFGVRRLAYVGYAPPIPVIPAGSIIRVSLARWWRPADKPDMEERCYLQLSGWYLCEQPTHSTRTTATAGQGVDPTIRHDAGVKHFEHSVAGSGTADTTTDYPRTLEAWTAAEDAVVRQLVSIAGDLDYICGLLKRHRNAVWERITQLGLQNEYVRYH